MKKVEKELIDNLKKHEIGKLEKKAIDEALEDVANGKMHSHQDVMEESKKLFPHLFNR